MKKKYATLFESVKIGKLEIRNRFAMAPMGPLGLADSDAGFNQRGIDYYTERAKGGTGLVITGVTFVDNKVEEHANPNVPCSTYNPNHFIRTSREMTERIHAYNSKIFLQLSAGFGRVTHPSPSLNIYPPVSASAVQHRWLDINCREMTVDEIKQIVKSFGDGAFNAKHAGFDGVQIHAVHEGYLLDQFAISLFNQRTDEYGGSLENRLRFAREIVEEIKARCGKDFPVTLRYSPKSFIKDFRKGAMPGEVFVEKGKDLPEGIEGAKLLVSYGYDALDVDVGSYDSWWWSHPPMYQKKGLYIEFAKAVKEAVDVPVICAGRMDDPDMAVAAVEDGACDIVSLGRPLLADADYVNKLKADKVDAIRPCLSCHEGCMGRIHTFGLINCAVNPQAGRERAFRLVPALEEKKVLVIGGGPAGCEAARVLALRGHKVTLCEKKDVLGGNLIAAGVPDFKEDDRALIKWYEHELSELGVKVKLDTKVEASDAMKYDTVVCATGSSSKKFSLGDDSKVFSAKNVLLGKKDVGDNVVIIGGGLVGCETALWLRQQGKTVTIVEALPKILALNGPLCHANEDMLAELIPYNGIEVKALHTAVKTTENGIILKNLETGEEFEIPATGIILCVGFASRNGLFKEIDAKHPEVYNIGDSRNVANIMYAIWDAYEVASNI